MRFLAAVLTLVFVLSISASAGFCQGYRGQQSQFAFGSLNGPTLEVRGEKWFAQGSWLLYFIDNDDFDDGFVLRGGAVFPVGGGGRAGMSGGQSPAEIAFGYSYINVDDKTNNSFTENGLCVQYIYRMQQNMSFRAGYDYFFDPSPGSIDNLITVGVMYHF